MSGNLGLDCNFIVIIFRAGYIITINTANSSMAKRKCNGSYIKFEFTSLNDQGIAKRQCVVCYPVLSNESLRPSKLSHHLNTSHPELKDGSMKYFKRLESNCKRQRLDSTDSFQQTDQKLSEASFVVSQIIARQKKTHNIGETAIKPSALATARIVLGEKYEKRLQSIPLSDNTVKRQIALMSEDIKEQIITEIKDKSLFGLFSIQIDESVDVASLSQLMVFVRYAVSTTVKEELLFCSALDTNTKASDVMEKVDYFFNEMDFRCLCPKVDFEHLCKRRHQTFCSLIASFTGKL